MTQQPPRTAFPLPDTPFDLVVFAASLGGIEALTLIFSRLPANFPAAIAVVQHRSPSPTSLLAQILTRYTGLTVMDARPDDWLCPGVVFLAPADFHLLIGEGGQLLLTQTTRVNFVRPSADLLFTSAASIFKNRLIGVVLTGGDGDGAEGIRIIKASGGVTIAQEHSSSRAPQMPDAAIATGCVDFILPPDAIASRLLSLVIPPDS